MTEIIVCIGLFVLTMGMFFIGYAVGRLEERKNVERTDDYISGDNSLGDFIMEMESKRNSDECDSVVGND